MEQRAVGGAGMTPAEIGKQMDSFAQSAAYMKTAAAEGQFAAAPESGAELVRVMRQRQAWLQRQMILVDQLGQEPPLGTTPAAQVVKPFIASLATDPNEGLLQALKKFDQVLQDTADAIEQSMKNYQDTDAGEADRINRISGQIHEV